MHRDLRLDYPETRLIEEIRRREKRSRHLTRRPKNRRAHRASFVGYIGLWCSPPLQLLVVPSDLLSFHGTNANLIRVGLVRRCTAGPKLRRYTPNPIESFLASLLLLVATKTLKMKTTHQPSDPFVVIDALYCEEESWEDQDGELEVECAAVPVCRDGASAIAEQDLFWEDDELTALFSKELAPHSCLYTDPFLLSARKEATSWMLKVIAYYSFCPATALLSVNYLDRFLATLYFQRDKPWMTQLSAVACLSLAAKVEETHVPLLLDLQVEDAKYVFEAKTIQRMELLVLSTLNWKMNPVTPLSFIEHIVRRLGLKTHPHWDFFNRCQLLLLALIPDSRLLPYLPSVLAAATMLQVINEMEPWNPIVYENELIAALKLSKENVEGCSQLIQELVPSSRHKRKYHHSSPLDISDNSNDSWASSVISSLETERKRTRAEQETLRYSTYDHHLYVDSLGSP